AQLDPGHGCSFRLSRLSSSASPSLTRRPDGGHARVRYHDLERQRSTRFLETSPPRGATVGWPGEASRAVQRIQAGLLALLAALVVACNGGDAEPEDLAVSLQEWEVGVGQELVEPGAVVIQISNQGT